MIGSTLIHATDPEKLAVLASDLEAIDDLAHIDLDVMLTLDFEMLVPPPLEWSADEKPIVFDEEGGLAILRVSPEALRYLLDHASTFDLDEVQRADLDSIRAFVDRHSADHIYEMTTL